LPPELALPAEVALVARIEALVEAEGGSTHLADHAEAIALARSPLAAAMTLDTPAARAQLGAVIELAVTAALAGGGAEFALSALRLAAEIGIGIGLDRAQERVYAALVNGTRPDLEPLGGALGLAVGALGLPT